MTAASTYQPRLSASDIKARVNLIDFAKSHGLMGKMSGKVLVALTPWRGR